jgi:hypothetical protein
MRVPWLLVFAAVLGVSSRADAAVGLVVEQRGACGYHAGGDLPGQGDELSGYFGATASRVFKI